MVEKIPAKTQNSPYQVNLNGDIIVDSMKDNPSLFSLAKKADKNGNGELEHNEIMVFFNLTLENNVKPKQMRVIDSFERRELIYFDDINQNGSKSLVTLNLNDMTQKTVITRNGELIGSKQISPDGRTEIYNDRTGDVSIFMQKEE